MEPAAVDVVRSMATINLGLSVLVIVFAYPLYRGMVGRNGLYGLRTRKSMASDEAWFTANKLAAACMMVGAAVLGSLCGAQLTWGLPLPAHLLDDVITYAGPVVLLASGAAAWLLHLRD